MKKWLKFTFLSFFSNKCAEIGKGLKFSNVLISFLLFSVVLPLFLSLGLNFNIDYTYATQENFKNALSHTFVTNKINYTYQDNKLSTNLIVNTFDNESDSPYIYGDFDFIIDTRNYQYTYDDFIFTAKDKQGNEVIYTPKLKDDINFVFEFAYSGKELDLTTKLNDCYTYLNDICNHESANYNISARADYEELERNKNTYSEDEYNKRIYTLYLQYYYPDLTKLGAGETTPTIRGYYLTNFIYKNDNNKNFMIFLDNVMYISFLDNNNQLVTYESFFSTYKANITVDDNTSDINRLESIKTIVFTSFKNSFLYNFSTFFINFFRLWPLFILFILILPALTTLIAKWKRIEQGFLDNVVIYTSFINIPSLVLALIGGISIIFFPKGIIFSLVTYIILGATLLRGLIRLISLLLAKKEEIIIEE